MVEEEDRGTQGESRGGSFGGDRGAEGCELGISSFTSSILLLPLRVLLCADGFPWWSPSQVLATLVVILHDMRRSVQKYF